MLQMTILAKDQGVPQRSSSVPVTIDVNRNLNRPVFINLPYTISIPETIGIGVNFFRANAVDNDDVVSKGHF